MTKKEWTKEKGKAERRTKKQTEDELLDGQKDRFLEDKVDGRQ